MNAIDRKAIGIGAPVRRVEDLRFLRGAGRFVDDIAAAGAAHLHMLRSPHAAARIVSIDTAAARAMPGVLLVLTEADLDIPARLRCVTPRHQRDGSPLVQPPWRVLPADAVRHVGDAVAAVVALTPAAAQDAAERIEVTYAPLPAVTDLAEAVRPGAPAVWPDLAPDNECFHFRLGDFAAVDAAFARAAQTVTLDYRISRVSANPMEPRNALAMHDPIEDRYTLYTGTQLPHVMRNEIAEFALGVASNRLRIVSPDVGGGFGMKESPFPEHVLCLLAARRLGRPVRWTATRTESFLSDSHARDNVSTAELALAADGDIPRHAGAHAGQHGRLPGLAGAGVVDQQCRRPRRRLSYAAYLHGGDGAFHQHPADRALSRRRAAGGDPCDGAAGRSRRRQAGHGPRGDPPPQHDPAGGDAVPDRARLRL